VSGVGLDLGTTRFAGLLLETGAAGRPARVLRVAQPGAYGRLPRRSLETSKTLKDSWPWRGSCCRSWSPKRAPLTACASPGRSRILYIDAAANAVSPLATWLDRRAGGRTRSGSFRRGAVRPTGIRVPPGYGRQPTSTILNNGLVPGTAAGCVRSMDFVTMRLAGRESPG